MTSTTNAPKSGDDDLTDLIASAAPHSYSKKDNNEKKYSKYFKPQYPSSSTIICQIPTLACYFLMSFMLKYPAFSKAATFILLGSALYFILVIVDQGKKEEIGIVKYDFSTVKSQLDFDIGKVDHWCIDHGDDCKCEDPLVPTPVTKKQWIHAHRNFSNLKNEPFTTDIDVVFLGQGVVEAMEGKHFGQDLSEKDDYFGHVQHMFNKRFQDPHPEKNFDLFGVTMGIAGDQANNILWRLMHGELDENFNPPFWWIVTGMEDLARYKCSEEIVIMGILRIVEEIKRFKPDAKIIINGLLPMTKLRHVGEPTESDFIDAKRKGDSDMVDRHIRRNLVDEDRTKSKEFKKNLADRLEKRYKLVIESHEAQEQKLRDSMKSTWKDKSIPKDEKKKISVQIKKSLEEMKEHHEKVQKSLVEYMKDLRKDTYNPVLQEKTTYHKDNLFHHRGDGGVPVWTAIHEINKQLHEFTSRTPRVAFYDPTSLFSETKGSHSKLLTNFISPRGHPTQAGYKLWLTDVQRTLMNWKKEMKEEAEARAREERMRENPQVDDAHGDDLFGIYGYDFDDKEDLEPYYPDESGDDGEDESADEFDELDDDVYYVEDDWM